MGYSQLERNPLASSAIKGHEVKAVVHPALFPSDHGLAKVQLAHFEDEEADHRHD